MKIAFVTTPHYWGIGITYTWYGDWTSNKTYNHMFDIQLLCFFLKFYAGYNPTKDC